MANANLAVQAREAVHRSANLLSVVTSLTRQTARGHERTDEFVDTLLGRIHSLARATSTVIRGDDNYSGDLGTIVKLQLEPVLLTYGERIDIQGPPTQIISEAAQQISLAIHELATNAQKYSFARDPGARVAIAWTVEDRDGSQLFTLTWREDLPGGGTAEEPSAEQAGFGTTLLTRIVPRVLRGTAVRTLADGKLEYRLEAPASAVLADPADTAAAALAARLVDENFDDD